MHQLANCYECKCLSPVILSYWYCYEFPCTWGSVSGPSILFNWLNFSVLLPINTVLLRLYKILWNLILQISEVVCFKECVGSYMPIYFFTYMLQSTWSSSMKNPIITCTENSDYINQLGRIGVFCNLILSLLVFDALFLIWSCCLLFIYINTCIWLVQTKLWFQLWILLLYIHTYLFINAYVCTHISSTVA